jgi:type IV pilus assembly protein PilB
MAAAGRFPALAWIKVSAMPDTSLAHHTQLPWFDLQKADFSLVQTDIIKHEIIQRYQVFPLSLSQNTLLLGMSANSDAQAIPLITFHTGFTIKLAQVDETALQAAIHTYCRPNVLYSQLAWTLSRLPPLQEETTPTAPEPADEPVADYLDHLFNEAIANHASDIHIEPQAKQYRIRFRRDGLLYEAAMIPPHLAIRLITRLKILAGLNIAEKRLPQDGRLQLKRHHHIDVRLNTCPTLYGEKIALRLLDTQGHSLTIDALGMTADQQARFIHHLSQPQGLILVTGPTGSGKTVTLYAALNKLNRPANHIVTVEDPVEIELAGINQVSIHPRIGLDFATALRTLLRQDPDILMIGEIRDAETAAIALQAAQTGHLVLATLHANSAQDSIARLHSLGIQPSELTASLSLVIAQRLVRVLCQHCKQHHLPAGCPHCIDGYAGRTGIYECLTPKQQSKPTLHEAGMQKVQAGITSHAELKRILGHEANLSD